MVEAKATIKINAVAEVVWDYMVRLDDWWMRSNPDEHIELSLIDASEIRKGTKFILKEYIAGVRGEAIAEITELVPLKRLVWKSNEASYNLFGIKFIAEEGGVFKLEENNGISTLSHHVWGGVTIPIIGWFTELFFKYILKGEKKDYEHTYRELQFIKREIEAQSA
mgnify:CR=1 FL=1